jgi:hypothetical protein
MNKWKKANPKSIKWHRRDLLKIRYTQNVLYLAGIVRQVPYIFPSKNLNFVINRFLHYEQHD